MIIGVSSLKGGVGKSTLACCIAAEYARRKKNVLLIDTDKIATSANWIDYRLEKPSLPPIEFEIKAPDHRLHAYLLKNESAYDVIVVDLQGGDNPENREILMLCDRIIYPIGVSQTELDTLPGLKKQNEILEVVTKKAAVTFHFLLNKAPTNTKRDLNEAIAWFEGLGIPLMETKLYDRKAYRTAMAEGYGVTEMDDAKAKEEIIQLVAELAITSLPIDIPKRSNAKNAEISASI